VIQDAYLAAFQSLAKFEDRGEGSFGAWLRRIIEHRVLAEVERHLEAGKRDARREVRIDTRGDALGPDPDQVSPSGEMAAAEEAARLHAAVDRLASDYREVIRWIHGEGLTLTEAGERMGRSADAVRKLYGRALARLSEILPKDGGGPP
jgi:RNA polymerase sigma-70 factor (ECF subfamily)